MSRDHPVVLKISSCSGMALHYTLVWPVIQNCDIQFLKEASTKYCMHNTIYYSKYHVSCRKNKVSNRGAERSLYRHVAGAVPV